jgi:hypothetical protein
LLQIATWFARYPELPPHEPVDNRKSEAVGFLIVDLLEHRIPVSPPMIVPTVIEPINHSSPTGGEIAKSLFTKLAWTAAFGAKL